MKKLILSLLLFSSITANAQTTTDSSSSKKTLFRKKSWELSLVGSFSSESVENGYPTDDITTLSFSVSPAYYIYDGLSLEPEFIALVKFYGNNQAANYQLLLNVAYTFRTKESFRPYIKAGYGIGDMTTTYFAGTAASANGAEDINEFVQCINTGVGAKWIVGSNAAIKTELNYRVQQYTYAPFYWAGESNESVDISISHFGILLGMSIFL
ncbi:MAG TPA: outer membrane beta-barrel protein [Candidatus Kapabacteria bacterium]